MHVELTEVEEAANSWLAWDDESVAKAVRVFALVHQEKFPGRRLLWANSCALMLVNLAREANSEQTALTIEGVTYNGEPIGKYRVTIERIEDSISAEPVSATYDGDKLTQVTFRVADDVVTAPVLKD